MLLNQDVIGRLRNIPVSAMRNFVDGDFLGTDADGEIAVISPGAGEPIGTILDRSEADVLAAIGAAELRGRSAVPHGPQRRKTVMFRIAGQIDCRALELAVSPDPQRRVCV